MPWNPDVYNKFKEKRYEPFYDLISHIRPQTSMHIIDLGCGTGELTRILSGKFPGSKLLGIDTSSEMLAKAPKEADINFALRSVQDQLKLDDKWDLIVANASLQWINDHHQLFPALIKKLQPGGQLAVQMPSQKENLLNRLLHELVHEPPYYEALKDVIRHSPVLSLDEYTQMMFSNGAANAVVYQKVYPIITDDLDDLYDFISGSALIPYLEKLQEPVSTGFTQEFKKRIKERFNTTPFVYSFKRIIMVAAF